MSTDSHATGGSLTRFLPYTFPPRNSCAVQQLTRGREGGGRALPSTNKFFYFFILFFIFYISASRSSSVSSEELLPLCCALKICLFPPPRSFRGSSSSRARMVLSPPTGEARCNILGGQHGREPGGSGRGGGGGRGGQGRRERSAPRRCTIARHKTGRGVV